MREESAVGACPRRQGNGSFPEDDALEVCTGASADCAGYNPDDVARECAAGKYNFVTCSEGEGAADLEDPCWKK